MTRMWEILLSYSKYQLEHWVKGHHSNRTPKLLELDMLENVHLFSLLKFW